MHVRPQGIVFDSLRAFLCSLTERKNRDEKNERSDE